MAKETSESVISANYPFCDICSQRIGESKKVRTTCEHEFHRRCIGNRFEFQSKPFTCPFCNAPFRNVETSREPFVECGICLKKIEKTPTEFFETSTCSHEFHVGCIEKYVKTQNVPIPCPTCSVPFKVKDYETLQNSCLWCGKEEKDEIFSRGYCRQCSVNATFLSRVLDYVDTKRFNFFDQYFRPLRFFSFDELQQRQRDSVLLYKSLIECYADTVIRLKKFFGTDASKHDSSETHFRAIDLLWNCVNVRNETFSLKTKKDRDRVSRTRFELEWFSKDVRLDPDPSISWEDDEKYKEFMKDYANVLIQLSAFKFTESVGKRLFRELVKLRYYMENFENGMLRTALLNYAGRNVPSDSNLFRLCDRIKTIEAHHLDEEIDHVELETCRKQLENIRHIHFNKYNLYSCSCEDCEYSRLIYVKRKKSIRSCKNFVETSIFSSEFNDAHTSQNSLFETRELKKLVLF